MKRTLMAEITRLRRQLISDGFVLTKESKKFLFTSEAKGSSDTLKASSHETVSEFKAEGSRQSEAAAWR